MSLRDQLLKSGLVNKKDVARINRELKEERKVDQGSRERKSALEAEKAKAEAAARDAALKEKADARKAREAAREAEERALQVRQLVLANRVRVRGKQRFYHRQLDALRIGELFVSDGVAFKLRCGELAIAAVRPRLPEETTQYEVIPAKAARRLKELDPSLLMLFVEDTRGIEAKDEAFHVPDWEIGLGPRRLRDGEPRPPGVK